MRSRFAASLLLATLSLAASCVLDRAGVGDTPATTGAGGTSPAGQVGSGGGAVSSSSSGGFGGASSTPASSSSPAASSSGSGGGGGGGAGAGGDGPLWHKPGYGHRRELTVNQGSVTGTQADFPLLVEVADSLTGLMPDASDLSFVDEKGGELAHELDGVGGGSVCAPG